MYIVKRIKDKLRSITLPQFKIGVFVLSSILAFVLIMTIIKKQKQDFNDIISAKDETIQQIQAVRESQQQLIVEKDKNIKYHEAREKEFKALETALIKQIAENANQHQSNKKEYDKIPKTVDNLSNAELRSEIANF